MLIAVQKPKKCSECPKIFTPFSGMQSVCSQRCALKMVRRLKAERIAEEKAERKRDKERAEAIKNIADRIAEAQTAFNGYIRARDAFKPCICCGKPFGPQRPGGSVDAGHFRSRDAAPGLRFSEDNCFGQRKNCNRPGGTKAAKFRRGVVARIGEARVLALEADNDVHKWTHQELIDIKARYLAKTKALKASLGLEAV